VRLAFVSPAAPGSIEDERSSPTSGGYLYDARVIAELRRAGHEVVLVSSLGLGTTTTPEALARVLAGYDGVVEDELGFDLCAPLNEVLRAIAPRTPLLALVHVPSALLAEAAGADDARVAAIAARERAFLRGVSGAVFVSEATRRHAHALLGEHGPSFVAEPGCDHFAFEPAVPRPGAPFHVVCVGHLLPYKGTLALIDVLEAFGAAVGDTPWSASVIGDDTVDEAHARAVRARLAASAVASHVTLLGRCSQARVAALYASADVFATASRYESYGIAAAEALSAGLPVVAWARGGLARLLAEPANGVVVPTDDVAAFARALVELRRTETPEARASRARAARATLPTWTRTAHEIAEAVATLLRGAGAAAEARAPEEPDAGAPDDPGGTSEGPDERR
jgi:glycosyltransferase involved in cell wall biosynthesis